jgi:hypothetical protein
VCPIAIDLAASSLGKGACEELVEEHNHCDVVDELQNSQLEGNFVVKAQNYNHSMQEAKIELEDLPRGDVLLERISDAERRDKVVGVHENMRKRVDKSAEDCGPAAKVQVEQKTPDWTNGGMVVDMQEGELNVFLPQHDKESVEKVKELR